MIKAGIRKKCRLSFSTIVLIDLRTVVEYGNLDNNDEIRTNTSYGNQVLQGIADGSPSKPALRQDTVYMVEKTYYDIAPYLGSFWAYLMPQ